MDADNLHVFCLCSLAVYEAPEAKSARVDAPYDGPFWLFVSKRGFPPPPERRAEMKGLPAGLRHDSPIFFIFLFSRMETRGSDF